MTGTGSAEPGVQTCGRGLAAHAPLPAALGRLTDAVADILDAHLPMLDVTDPYSAREEAAYVRLVEEHRRTAALLSATAERMAGYRDLPMGRHVDDAAAGAQMAERFARFVALEEELVALLEARLRQDRAMLDAMRGGGARRDA